MNDASPVPNGRTREECHELSTRTAAVVAHTLARHLRQLHAPVTPEPVPPELTRLLSRLEDALLSRERVQAHNTATGV